MCQLLKYVQQQQLLGLDTYHDNTNRSYVSGKLPVEALLHINFTRTFMQVYFSALTFRTRKHWFIFSSYFWLGSGNTFELILSSIKMQKYTCVGFSEMFFPAY